MELFLRDNSAPLGDEQEKELEIYKLEQKLIEFRVKTPRIDNKTKLLDWWAERKSEFPELYKLQSLANAVPMTQVSVERLFSSMKFIFSDLRGNLLPSLLQAILVVRCNGLFKKSKPLKRARKASRNLSVVVS